MERSHASSLAIVLIGVLAAACNSDSRQTPTAPTAPAALESNSSESSLAAMSVGFDSGFAVQSVAFPPRNEPFAFRQQLETVYQVQLRRNPISTFVDIEGTIVWTQEYLRYRLSGCGHSQSVENVLAEIDGAAGAPDCGGNVAFPPRNEPFDFRSNSLEAKYRDGLRRGPVQTYVDIEGDIVWTTEYLRYRVSGCDHATAVQLVIAQIGGSAPTAGCQTFTLVGVVSDGTLGGPVPGAAVTATDSKGTSRSTTTDGGGFFSFPPLVPGAVTLRVVAAGFDTAIRTLTLSSDQRFDVTINRSAPPWSQSGIGNAVFDMPRTFARVRIIGTYTGSGSNFIVRIGGRLVVNDIIGTRWPSTISSGTYLTGGGGVVEITNSSGVTWSFTEVP